MVSVHRMPPRDEPFDPRQAALAHAGMAEGLAVGDVLPMVDGPPVTPRILGQLASAVAGGLVYVGDQVAAAVGRPMAREAFADDRLVKALARIRDHEEHFGSGSPEDEMREIAREALRLGYPTSDEVPSEGPTFADVAEEMLKRRVPRGEMRVAEPQSPLVGAQVVGWEGAGGSDGVLVRVATGATYKIQVGMPFEIPARVVGGPTPTDSWREFLREQAAQIPEGIEFALRELLSQLEGQREPVQSLTDWLNQLSNVRQEVADGRAGD